MDRMQEPGSKAAPEAEVSRLRREVARLKSALAGAQGRAANGEEAAEGIERLDAVAGEAQRVSEERFQRLLANSSDVTAVMDRRGRLVTIHGPLQKTLGYEPEDQLGKNAFDLVHPDDLASALQVFGDALPQLAAVRRGEYRLRHKDGSWVTVELVGTYLLEDPIIRGVVLNVRDISERVKLQEQLQQAMKMEAIGRLAGGVAHDFNNLLTAIVGNAELGRRKLAAADPLVRFFDEITKAADSATSLTRQLLAFSRRQIIEPVVLDLNDLVRNLELMLKRLIGEDVSLETALGEDLGNVRVDPGQFEQVLVNLVVNARDAMPNGGTLRIGTWNLDLDAVKGAMHPGIPLGRYVLLSVTDTGLGMSEDVKRHLFEPFYTTKPKERGTGLGLAMAFGAVKQAAGGIEVDSERGRGTSVTIFLPRTDEPAQARLREDPLLAQTRGTETVLLVEDESTVRDVVQLFLTGQGYTVLEAPNGWEAFVVAERHRAPIDLLMTDVVLPGMNGRELAERLCAIHPEMKVLFTSGYTDDVVLHHGVVNQDLNFIGKPYAFRDLANKIRTILGPEDR
jgi:PAS domain S-box-containing protein